MNKRYTQPEPGAVAVASPRAKAPRTGEVRIIAGIWKRSRLKVVNRPGLRPTPDRVRETLFNWLGADLSGWRVLDAFAGSGALGLEAASRGADEVVLLDNDERTVRQLLATHQRLQAPPSVRIERADALNWMQRCSASRFELIFIDPPFDNPQAHLACERALRLLVPGGWLVIESSQPLAPPEAGLETRRQLRAGAVHLELRQRLMPD